MGMRTDHRGSFNCRGDDGNSYTVDRVVHVLTEERGDRKVERDGSTIYRCNGHDVRRVSSGRYLTWNGIKLRAMDADAP